jgi:hypothetical protein
MSKDHQKKKNRKVQKRVNPASVPTKNKIKITEDDPRNNALYQELSETTYEIVKDDTDFMEDFDISEDLWDEDNDPTIYSVEDDENLFTPTPENMIDNSTGYGLTAPTNLYIDPKSFSLEDGNANSDGVVRWTAYLYFDDVYGADDYEYTITARVI